MLLPGDIFANCACYKLPCCARYEVIRIMSHALACYAQCQWLLLTRQFAIIGDISKSDKCEEKKDNGKSPRLGSMLGVLVRASFACILQYGIHACVCVCIHNIIILGHRA